jgi:4-amino-4-deoxy-L-arabinose transferase-like glycosyltransferase
VVKLDPDRWTAAWRGPLLAAVVAMLAGLPGLIAMPVLDRDEARFAQASAQMAETGDITSINFQREPRHKKPVGVYWLQAFSVSAFSNSDARQIWPYRLPSLLGAMVAAAACAWGASGFFGHRRGFIAGALFGACLLLSTEAFIAKADAALCGALTLAMAALARLYGASRQDVPAYAGTKWVFWWALAVSILIKGPIGPMVAGLTVLALWAWDRRAGWLSHLGFGWGFVLVALLCIPWAWAITVATDGAFWAGAVGGDMLGKLATGGQESHGAPPGLHTALLPLLSFPMTFLLPAAALIAWRRRRDPGVRFALAWLIPSWLLFEIFPTKLPHYTLPLYGAVAWLAVAALPVRLRRITRWSGAALGLLVAIAAAIGVHYAARTYGGVSAAAWAWVAGGFLLAAGLAGAILLLVRRPAAAVLSAGALTVVAHGLAAAAVAPRLEPLWIARRTFKALNAANLDPRDGMTPGPVAVAGFAEPSMVFKLGTPTELTDGRGAAQAIAEGRPALVEAGQLPAFLDALKDLDVTARPAARVRGLNYSKGDPVDLILYRSGVSLVGAQP